jgi:hypothetical protein
MVAKVLDRAQGGSIVLMHLGGYETFEALPRAPALTGRDCRRKMMASRESIDIRLPRLGSSTSLGSRPDTEVSSVPTY